MMLPLYNDTALYSNFGSGADKGIFNLPVSNTAIAYCSGQ